MPWVFHEKSLKFTYAEMEKRPLRKHYSFIHPVVHPIFIKPPLCGRSCAGHLVRNTQMNKMHFLTSPQSLEQTCSQMNIIHRIWGAGNYITFDLKISGKYSFEQMVLNLGIGVKIVQQSSSSIFYIIVLPFVRSYPQHWRYNFSWNGIVSQLCYLLAMSWNKNYLIFQMLFTQLR